MERTTHFALVGPGRAGTAMAGALTRAGWLLRGVAGRTPESTAARHLAERFGGTVADLADVARGAQVVVIATPDDAVARTAAVLGASIERGALVLHLAGSLGLEVFEPLGHARPDVLLAAAHPLQTLPGLEGDDGRLAGAWFAVEGDPQVGLVVEAAGGRGFRVSDRAGYHAAACVASNHLVALLGQLERLAAAAAVPIEAFTPLLEATMANVVGQGAAASLSGPVARGDAATVAKHLEALTPDERPAYRSLAREALRLTGRDDPALEAVLAEPTDDRLGQVVR